MRAPIPVSRYEALEVRNFQERKGSKAKGIAKVSVYFKIVRTDCLLEIGAFFMPTLPLVTTA